MRNLQISPFDETDIDSIANLYCKTFNGNNYSPDDVKMAAENIMKHVSYKGFTGLTAKDKNGELLGFSYGYTSMPYQFYRKKLEGKLTEQQSDVWLSDCYELVELVVDPKFKRIGIGSLLHDELVKQTNHKTSILTTNVDNLPAINLYQNKGWEIIKGNVAVISEFYPQVIMGKALK